MQPVTEDVAALDAELTDFLEGVISESKEEVAGDRREKQREAAAAAAAAEVEAEAAVPAEVEGTGEEKAKKAQLTGRGGAKEKEKPAWSLSVEEAAEAEAEEEAELLRFAESLDYDAYIAECDDEDLKEAWRLMKEVREPTEASFVYTGRNALDT